jgi:tRNA (guanine-N7-)-methyltransferase
MRTFPYEHASRRQARFYPAAPEGSIRVDCLEVGPGRGDFLFTEAAENPDKRFAAIEIKKRRYLKLIDRVEKRELRNILLVQADARIVLPDLIPAGSLETAYILFPDPWPKRRHIEMRLLSVEFLSLLGERLRIGGEIVIATDDQEFAIWIRRNILRVPLLEIAAESASTEETPVHTPTHYEKKWKAEGRTIATIRCRRVAAEVRERTPVSRQVG